MVDKSNTVLSFILLKILVNLFDQGAYIISMNLLKWLCYTIPSSKDQDSYCQGEMSENSWL